MLLLGASGAWPPRKILKIALLRLNLEVILTEDHKCKFCAGHLYILNLKKHMIVSLLDGKLTAVNSAQL